MGDHLGPHRSGIVASFAGDGTNKLSQNSGDLVVSQTSTTTSLTSSANPSVFGQSVTFTATVAAVSPGSGTPTGTVNFLDGTTTIGTGIGAQFLGRSDLQHQHSDGQRQPALDHCGLLRRHELHYQYLECRFPGCELLGKIHSGSDLES